MMILSRTYRVLCLSAALSSLLVLSGCAMGTMQLSGSSPSGPVAGAALKGSAYGGQQPIIGATITLNAAGTSGYGTGNSNLLTSTVTTSDGTGVPIVVTASSLDVTGTTATFTATNTLSAGNTVDLAGFSAPGLFLNGQSVTVATATSTQFTATVANGTSSLTTGNGVAVLASGNDANANAGNEYNVLNAGSFNISGDYTCPSGSSQIYLESTGGSSYGAGTNGALALIAALGSCSSLSASTFITINEVTTVAAVTALQQFMSVSYGTAFSFGIGAPSTTYNGVASGIVGMTNAFATANVLASSATGKSVQVNSTGTGVPTTIPEIGRVNTEANILATCVNSVNSGSNPSTTCSNLFADLNNTNAKDTVQAMYSMATNPQHNVTTLCAVNTPQTVFSPVTACNATAASGKMSDFSIAIGYFPIGASSAAAIDSTYGVAVDAYGNVWTVSDNGALFGVTEMGPTGTLLTGPLTQFTVGTGPGTVHTFNAPHYLVIDQGNNAWVPNNSDTADGGYVAVLPGSSGTNVATSTTNSTQGDGYADDSSVTTPADPYAITVDSNNNVYITNAATGINTVSEFANAGSTFTESASLSASAVSPTGIVTDTSSSTPFVYVSVSAATCTSPATGDIAEFNNSVSNGATPGAVFATTPTTNCTSPQATSALAATTGKPLGMAVDANDNLWVVDNANGTVGVTYLVTNGAGGIGTGSASSVSATGNAFLAPQSVAVDGNNNAWVFNTSGHVFSEVSATVGTPTTITNITGTVGISHDDNTNTEIQTARVGAIDSSGNIWISNSVSGGATYLTNVVGLAAPVVTPTAIALKLGRVGQKP
jgi:hypothetical protein